MHLRVEFCPTLTFEVRPRLRLAGQLNVTRTSVRVPSRYEELSRRVYRCGQQDGGRMSVLKG